MSDPITLSALGALALTEGVKFLYNQAAEILKRWLQRKDATTKDAKVDLPKKEALTVDIPPIFEGQLSSIQIHFDAVEKLEKPLLELKRDLSGYADGSEQVNTNDKTLLEQVDALRCLIEAIYQQRITFKGEQRPSSGPVVEGRISVQDVEGRVGGVIAKIIRGNAHVKGEAEIKGTVKHGGEAGGVNIDTIGA